MCMCLEFIKQHFSLFSSPLFGFPLSRSAKQYKSSLFVTDYPPKVQAEDIMKVFNAYGTVDTVEYKGKISFVNFLRDDEAVAVSDNNAIHPSCQYI